MKRALTIGIAVSTINLGLWMLPRPGAISPPSSADTLESQRQENPLKSSVSPAETSDSGKDGKGPNKRPSSDVDLSTKQGGSGRSPDSDMTGGAPAQRDLLRQNALWLEQVQMSVLQTSQGPSFVNRLRLVDVDCAGVQCEISGRLVRTAEGRVRARDIATFMEELNRGDVAGGDTGRRAMIRTIHPTGAAGGAPDFEMVISAADGPPPINQCQGVLDAWQSAHPDDFADQVVVQARPAVGP